jgi:glutamine synthetase
MRFATLTRMADNVMIYKYVVKNVARLTLAISSVSMAKQYAPTTAALAAIRSVWAGDIGRHHFLMRSKADARAKVGQ